jgi:hypothetical protein
MKIDKGDMVKLAFSFPQVGEAGMVGIVLEKIDRPSGDWGYTVKWSNGGTSNDVHQSNVERYLPTDDFTKALLKWIKYYEQTIN